MKLLQSIGLSALISIVMACSTMEGPEIISLSPSETISRIVINSDFIMMQLGDTHTIDVKVITLDKSEMEIDANKIVWLSQDTSQLEVDNHGRLQAKIVNDLPVRIIVSYKENLNTVKDTVQVYITPGRIEGRSMKLTVLDSNRVGGGFPSYFMLGSPRVRVDIFDDSEMLLLKGAPVPILTEFSVTSQFDLTGGDDNEPVYNIMNEGGWLGKFWIKSSVNLYGIAVADSVQFTGIYSISTPFFFEVIYENAKGVIPRIQDTTQYPQIQPCGVFSITNYTSKALDIIFTDSLSIGTCGNLHDNVTGVKVVGGNILNLPPGERGIRRIRTVGIVDYYVRDAVTKERSPFTGRYESIEYSN